MLSMVAALLFIGYTLAYAAIAKGGKFAATPWDALRQDAYTGEHAGNPGVSASSSGHQSTWDHIVGIGAKILPWLLP